MLVTDKKLRALKKRIRNGAHRTYARTHNRSAANLDKNMKQLPKFPQISTNAVEGPQDFPNACS